MRIRMAGATDVGRIRKANQDSLFFDGSQGIGIVADGIGGRSGGEIASSMAVSGLYTAFINSEILRHEEIHPFMMANIDHINRKIIDRGKRDQNTNGMGTTLNCLVFLGNKLHLAHIGDSRTYLFYKNQFWQLTIDHNVKTFLERGWMTEQSVVQGSSDSALVKALGLFEKIDVDFYQKTLVEDEIFVTASDGLFDMVSDREITAIIQNHAEDFDRIPQLLIEAANRQGGRDNITVLLSKVLGA